jgi:hypothetical protein
MLLCQALRPCRCVLSASCPCFPDVLAYLACKPRAHASSCRPSSPPPRAAPRPHHGSASACSCCCKATRPLHLHASPAPMAQASVRFRRLPRRPRPRRCLEPVRLNQTPQRPTCSVSSGYTSLLHILIRNFFCCSHLIEYHRVLIPLTQYSRSCFELVCSWWWSASARRSPATIQGQVCSLKWFKTSLCNF